ncbi:unnamed protein product [Mortierella alpina]
MVQNRWQEEQQTLGRGTASTFGRGVNVGSGDAFDATRTARLGSTRGDPAAAAAAAEDDGPASAAVDATDDAEQSPRRGLDRKGKNAVVRREDLEEGMEFSGGSRKNVSSCIGSSTTTDRAHRLVVGLGSVEEADGDGETGGGEEGSCVGVGRSREGTAEKEAAEDRDGGVEKEGGMDGETEVCEHDKEAAEEPDSGGVKSEGTGTGACDEVAGVGSCSATEDEEEETEEEEEEEEEKAPREDCADEDERGCDRPTAAKGRESVGQGKTCDQGEEARAEDRAARTPDVPRPVLRGSSTAPTPAATPAPVLKRPLALQPAVASLATATPARPAVHLPRILAANTPPAAQAAPRQAAAVNTAPAQRTPAQAAVANAAAAFSAFRFVPPVIQAPALRRGSRAAQARSHRQTSRTAPSMPTTQPTARNTGAIATAAVSPPAPTSQNSVIIAVTAAAAGSSGLFPSQPFTFTVPATPPANRPPSAAAVTARMLTASSAATSSTSIATTTPIGTPLGSNASPTTTANRELQAHQALCADRRQRAHAQWLHNEQFKRQQAQTLQAIMQDQVWHRQQQQLQKQEEERQRQLKLQAIQQMFAEGARRYQAHGLPPTPFVYPSHVDNMWVHWSPATALAPAKRALLSKHGSTQTSDVRKRQQMFKMTWKKVEVRPSKYPFRPLGQDSEQPQVPRVQKVCAVPRIPVRRAPIQRRTGQCTGSAVTSVPVVQKMPAIPWPTTTANTISAHAPSTKTPPSVLFRCPVPHPSAATTSQGDIEMQLSSQAAIRMWRYVPLHPDPEEATRLAFLNLCAAHRLAGFTFSGVVLEYGWTHLSQCLPQAGQVGGEVAARNAQTVADLKRTMSTWQYEPLHADATTAVALAHLDFDAANERTRAGSFGALLLAMGRQHLDSCVAKPMDWMRSPASTPLTTTSCAMASQPPAHLTTRLLNPATSFLASAPCTLASAPLASAPLASAPLAPPSTLAVPIHTPPSPPQTTPMLPLPAQPFSLPRVPSIAAAAAIPQIAVAASTPTPTANAVGVSALSATLVSPASRLIATPRRRARTLGTPLAPPTPLQPLMLHASPSANGSPVEQPRFNNAQENVVDDSSSTVFSGDNSAIHNGSTSESSGSDSEAETVKHEQDNSSDSESSGSSDDSVSGGSDSAEILTSASVPSDSECEGGHSQESSDSSDSTDASPSESNLQSQKSKVPSRRRKLEMIQSDRHRRQHRLHQRVLGSPVFDMVRLGLAKLLPKGKRLLKQGLGRCISRQDDRKVRDSHLSSGGSSNCSTRSSRSRGVERSPVRPWRCPHPKENIKLDLSDFSGGTSDGDSDNSEDSGYHPSPTLSIRKHSNRTDGVCRALVFKSSAPVQSSTAGEASTKLQKRERSQLGDDNEPAQSSGEDFHGGEDDDDSDGEQRPSKRRLKSRPDGGTKSDLDHQRGRRSSKLRNRRQKRSARTLTNAGGSCTALESSPSIVSGTAGSPDASITPVPRGTSTEPASVADGLTRAIQRLRRVIDTAPKDIEVCTPSELEQERTRLLEAAEVVFYNQARQYNPPGSISYTPVPQPSNPARSDMASYTLPSEEAVSYAPAPGTDAGAEPEAKDADLGMTVDDAAQLDFCKAQSYHVKYNLPDRLQPLRAGETSELKAMMDQNIRKRRAMAEDMTSDRWVAGSLPEREDDSDHDRNDTARKLKARRVEY